jgi:hypothetical protein
MARNVVIRSVKIPISQATELDLIASKAGVARNQILKLAITEFLLGRKLEMLEKVK